MTNGQHEMIVALTDHRDPMPQYTAGESGFLKRWLNADDDAMMSERDAQKLDLIYAAYRPEVTK